MNKVEKKIEVLEKQINKKENELNNSQNNTWRRQNFYNNKLKDIEKLKFKKNFFEFYKEDKNIELFLNENLYEHLYYKKKYPTVESVKEYSHLIEKYDKMEKLLKKNNIDIIEYNNLLTYFNKDFNIIDQKQIIIKKKSEILLKKIPGFFPTPKKVLEIIEEKIKNYIPEDLKNMIMLEPSAGSGNIVEYFLNKVKNIDCIEYNYNLRELLKEQNFNVVAEDIYKSDDKKYDLIIMNPPFENKQDIRQVKYCFENKLNENGYLIAITSSSAIELESNKEFKNFIYENLIFEPFILKNAFKESNTGVSVSIFGLKK